MINSLRGIVRESVRFSRNVLDPCVRSLLSLSLSLSSESPNPSHLFRDERRKAQLKRANLIVLALRSPSAISAARAEICTQTAASVQLPEARDKLVNDACVRAHARVRQVPPINLTDHFQRVSNLNIVYTFCIRDCKFK